MRRVSGLAVGLLLLVGCQGSTPTAQSPELVTALVQRAEAAFQEGDFTAAAGSLEKALELAPDNPEILFAAGSVQYERGSDVMKEDPSAAIAAFEQAEGHLRRLRELTAEVDAETEELFQTVLLSKARALVRVDQPAPALAALQEAIEAGFDNLLMLQVDTDFANLRARPEFATLAQRVEQQKQDNDREEVRRLIAEQKPFEFSFSLPDTAGDTVSLSDYRGKVVIVDFWGTWCGVCLQEVPHFIQLLEQYRDQGLEVVGLTYETVAAEEIPETIRRSVESNGINYPCLIGDPATQNQVPGFQGFPTTLFIDRRGDVRLMHTGYLPYERLETIVAELLESGENTGG